jgi:hypothetical protein
LPDIVKRHRIFGSEPAPALNQHGIVLI